MDLGDSDTWQSFSKHITRKTACHFLLSLSAVTLFISGIGIQALEEKKKVHNLSLTVAEMANATTQVIQDQ